MFTARSIRKVGYSQSVLYPAKILYSFSSILSRCVWFMGNNQSMATPFIIKPDGKHTATVIFLHGLGDTGQGWCTAFEMIKQPHIKYICPNAPINPVTLNGGFRMPSWFDIKGLSPSADEDVDGIKKAAEQLQKLVDEEAKLVSHERVMVGGFSQGGAVALYSALMSAKEKRCAGIIGLSTWMPCHKQFMLPAAAKQENLPIFQGHGTGDPVVSFNFGKLTCKLLEQHTDKHQFQEYKDMGHMSCSKEMDDVKSFIENYLPAI